MRGEKSNFFKVRVCEERSDSEATAIARSEATNEARRKGGAAHVALSLRSSSVVTKEELFTSLLHCASLLARLPTNTSLSQIGCVVFIAANLVNVLAGYFCWGKECHEIYVAISLFPALASGLHFAAGALFRAPPKVAAAGFTMQAFSSLSTYFLFKASDDILKTFALCRFFEIYFIAPHYVGYFVSRFNDSGLTLDWLKVRGDLTTIKATGHATFCTRRSPLLTKPFASLPRAQEGLELLGVLPGKKGSNYESDPRKWGKAIRAMSSKGYLGLEGKAC